MDKLIEDAEILKVGRKSFDVSNISVHKKKIARRIWNEMTADYIKDLEDTGRIEETENKYSQIISDLYDTLGLFFIRQEFIVLKRKFSLLKAIYEYIRRLFITRKYLNRCNEEEYNNFQEWVHFTITGTKKKDLQVTEKMQQIQIMMVEKAERMGISLDQLTESLATLLDGMVGSMNTSAHFQKQS